MRGPSIGRRRGDQRAFSRCSLHPTATALQSRGPGRPSDTDPPRAETCQNLNIPPRRRAVSISTARRDWRGDPDTRWCRCSKPSHVRCIVSIVSSEAPTSPPLLPRCTAWPPSLNLSSLSWRLVHLAGGHHRLRDLPIVFPGEFPSSLVLKFVPSVGCYI